ncbi:MAG: hypothetical protein JST55_14640 [Bacteroidetes bacterium]|nr:hypothetical protein [Bacteroidota bacterium]
MILTKRNIFGEALNMVHINSSFGSEQPHTKKKPLAFYIFIMLGIFILLNAVLIGLLFFR